MTTVGTTKSNCLLFVLQAWWTDGGYVVLRQSRYGKWPHALWSPDLRTFSEFVPNRSHLEELMARPWWLALIRPPLWFDGHVKQWSTC